MSAKYQIIGLLKFAELDNFENGCDPDKGTSQYIELTFTGKTAEAAIQAAAEFLGIKEDGIERNACDEDGRVDFARTENEDTDEPTAAELEAWKRGEIDLYYCVYSGIVEKIETVRI